MRIYDWKRTSWRTIESARKDDGILCTWENSKGDTLKYGLSDDYNSKYVLIDPNDEVVDGFDRRQDIREAATRWLEENGRPGYRQYKVEA